MAINPSVPIELLESSLVELEKYGDVSILKDMAILSLVGKEMRNRVGTASEMFAVLAANGVNIEMISQGASEINISCVIEEEKAVIALRAVHSGLILGG